LTRPKIGLHKEVLPGRLLTLVPKYKTTTMLAHGYLDQMFVSEGNERSQFSLSGFGNFWLSTIFLRVMIINFTTY